jgi:hypothetical protein
MKETIRIINLPKQDLSIEIYLWSEEEGHKYKYYGYRVTDSKNRILLAGCSGYSTLEDCEQTAKQQVLRQKQLGKL